MNEHKPCGEAQCLLENTVRKSYNSEIFGILDQIGVKIIKKSEYRICIVDREENYVEITVTVKSKKGDWKSDAYKDIVFETDRPIRCRR